MKRPWRGNSCEVPQMDPNSAERRRGNDVLSAVLKARLVGKTSMLLGRKFACPIIRLNPARMHGALLQRAKQAK